MSRAHAPVLALTALLVVACAGAAPSTPPPRCAETAAPPWEAEPRVAFGLDGVSATAALAQLSALTGEAEEVALEPATLRACEGLRVPHGRYTRSEARAATRAAIEQTCAAGAPSEPVSSFSMEGITRVAPDELHITARRRGELVRELGRDLYRILFEEDGVVIGLRVYGIRRASLLATIGVQNGDVLMRGAGIDLTSEGAQRAFVERLEGIRGPVELEIARGESSVSLYFRFVE